MSPNSSTPNNNFACTYCASASSLHSLMLMLLCKHFSLQSLGLKVPERILHEISFCSLQRHRTCYLCAALDHVSSSCPQDLCSYCYRPKHRGRVSPDVPIPDHFGMGPSRFVTLQTIVFVTLFTRYIYSIHLHA